MIIHTISALLLATTAAVPAPTPAVVRTQPPRISAAITCTDGVARVQADVTTRAAAPGDLTMTVLDRRGRAVPGLQATVEGDFDANSVGLVAKSFPVSSCAALKGHRARIAYLAPGVRVVARSAALR